MPYICDRQQILVTIYVITMNTFASFGNEIVEEPFISCSADAIYAKWKTTTTFVGHVNVRHAPNRFCYQVLVTNNQIELLIPHQDCQVSRIRSLRPFGVIIATSVLISFHPHYVTAGDRIYFLQCFHTRASDHSLLPGSVVPATSASKNAFYGSVSMPRCDYQIRNLKDNELTDSTAIGEMVQHRWSCSTGSNEELCLIVTNCFMITSDSRHQLVDKNGCSLDRSVLPNLVYIDNLNVEQNVSVFGLSQKPFVYFQCQISLLQPNFGRCLQPNCSNNHRTRRGLISALESDKTQIFDVVSQSIEILDLDRRLKKESCHRSPEVHFGHVLDDQIVCLTWTFFVATTILITSLILGVITTTIVLLFRRTHCHDIT